MFLPALVAARRVNVRGSPWKADLVGKRVEILGQIFESQHVVDKEVSIL